MNGLMAVIRNSYSFTPALSRFFSGGHDIDTVDACGLSTAKY